ncbi:MULTISPECIES: VOC family protein [unclassified Legionella]|uniref:VOC family protein n=1 Tax=unclassified Legionella TaxID=2622702 RepID=UPI001055982A
MFKKVAFTMYPVLDIHRARKFYEVTLGLKPGKVEEQWVEYDLPGGGCLAITNWAEGGQPSSNSGGSVAFEVDDLDALMTQLKEKNVEVKLDIFSSPVCRMAIIVDSEGNALTLHQLHVQ